MSGTTRFHEPGPAPVDAIDQDVSSWITESKGLEQVISRVRWLGVIVIVVMAFLHPTGFVAMLALAGVLAVGNAVACIANSRITRPVSQRALAVLMLAVDAAVVLGVIFLFARDFYTAAYAAFAIVAIEGGLRFGLRGGLAMGLLFALGLLAAMFYREA
ncbi:MAG: hypothetical protein IBX68_06260, partial [Dehalococcoidia bacterium]|nr:hypothetical protein [Dehalococcoidia bacterium]